jgi:hypothetical protein
MRMLLISLLALALLAMPLHASTLNVVSPVDKVAQDGEELFIGDVGPGQTVFIEADAIVKTGGKFGLGGRWDRLDIVNVPDGWTSENSLLYEQPLKALIKVAPNASDGDYIVRARAVDIEGKEALGQVNLRLRVHVTRGVFSMEVSPLRAETGATQPASFTITIHNNGVASDAFEISSEGVPTWNFRKTVFVPYGATRVVQYEFASSEEGEYAPVIRVTSLSSPLLGGRQNVQLGVSTSLWSDYRATNNGLLLFPIFEQAAYSVMGLISNLF